LKKILTCHVVAGKMTSKDIAEKIKMGGGRATLKTTLEAASWFSPTRRVELPRLRLRT
jgi:uncharacterized surface protein with fasciclin (FAS1) repeats